MAMDSVVVTIFGSCLQAENTKARATKMLIQLQFQLPTVDYICRECRLFSQTDCRGFCFFGLDTIQLNQYESFFSMDD